MFPVMIGSLGFLCYFAYDINSITKNNRFLQKGFLFGTLLVAIGTLGMLVGEWNHICWTFVSTYIFILVSIVMFGLLIYTLFFALPFQSTYVEESCQRIAYTEGVYALCRHPGVLWYAGMYIGIAGMTGSWKSIIQGMIFILWNVLYIALQDRVIFPKTFTNYNEYKKTTPFLIPNKKSVEKCFKTIKKGGHV